MHWLAHMGVGYEVFKCTFDKQVDSRPSSLSFLLGALILGLIENKTINEYSKTLLSIYTMFAFQRKRVRLENYTYACRKVHTVYNLSAPHKHDIPESEENCYTHMIHSPAKCSQGFV
jgi:hypothetical protein